MKPAMKRRAPHAGTGCLNAARKQKKPSCAAFTRSRTGFSADFTCQSGRQFYLPERRAAVKRLVANDSDGFRNIDGFEGSAAFQHKRGYFGRAVREEHRFERYAVFKQRVSDLGDAAQYGFFKAGAAPEGEMYCLWCAAVFDRFSLIMIGNACLTSCQVQRALSIIPPPITRSFSS